MRNTVTDILGICTIILIFTNLVLMYDLLILPGKYETDHAKSERPYKIIDVYSDDFSNDDLEVIKVDRDEPLVWIGGYFHSGTNLLCQILGLHKFIKCLPENYIMLDFLASYNMLHNHERFTNWEENGISDRLMYDSIGAFILTLLSEQAGPFQRLSNVLPLDTMPYIKDLANIFPKSKFIVVIRDGRAVIDPLLNDDQIIMENRTSGSVLQAWNEALVDSYGDCIRLGPIVCRVVHFEQIILDPENTVKSLLKFIGEDTGEVPVVSVESSPGPNSSLNEIPYPRMPIYKSSLYEWVKNMEREIMNNASSLAPLLFHQGYHPESEPNYDNLV